MLLKVDRWSLLFEFWGLPSLVSTHICRSLGWCSFCFFYYRYPFYIVIASHFLLNVFLCLDISVAFLFSRMIRRRSCYDLYFFEFDLKFCLSENVFCVLSVWSKPQLASFSFILDLIDSCEHTSAIVWHVRSWKLLRFVFPWKDFVHWVLVLKFLE